MGALSIRSHYRAAENQRHKKHTADLLNNMASPCSTAHDASSLLGPSTTVRLPPSGMCVSVHCVLMVASKASSQGVLRGRILTWSQLCSVNSSSSPPLPLCWSSQIAVLKWAVARGHCCFGKMRASLPGGDSDELVSQCQGMLSRKERTNTLKRCFFFSTLAFSIFTLTSAFPLMSFGRRLNDAS